MFLPNYLVRRIVLVLHNRMFTYLEVTIKTHRIAIHLLLDHQLTNSQAKQVAALFPIGQMFMMSGTL